MAIEDHEKAQNGAEMTYIRRTSVVERKGTSVKAASLICSTTTLPTLFALPSALAALTWTGGLVVMLISSLGAFYCFYRLVELNEFGDTGRHKTYPDLASAVSSRKWVGDTVQVLQFTVQWGVAVANIIMAAQFMLDIYRTECSGCTGMTTTLFTLVATAAFLVFGFLPDLSERNLFILINGSFTIVYCSIAIVLSFVNNEHSTADFSLVGSEASIVFNALANIGVVFFVYGDTMYPELQSFLKPDKSGSTISTMKRGMYIAFGITIPLLLLVGVAGYWSFGNAVSPILLSSAWTPRWLVFIAVLVSIIQLIFSSQVMAQPIYNSMELRVMKKWSGQKWMQHQRRHGVVASLWLMVLIRFFYAVSVGFIAIFFPFFSSIMGLIGAIGLTPVVYVVPLSLWIISKKESTNYLLIKISHLILALIFTIGGLLAAVGAMRGIIVSFDTFTLG